MNTPAAKPTIRVACRHCGMVMQARREHVGRSAACPRCERVIRLEETPEPEHPSGLPAPKPAPKPVAPTTTSVSCRLCGTRMAFELKHVGRKAKCPDCGALTEVPPPPAPEKPKPPAAMQGVQYEVWQGDDQPWGVDLARNAPQRIRVTCGLCQTLIDAAPEQIGRQVTCPDCGRENRVERPKPPPPGAKLNPLVMPSYRVDDAPPPESPISVDEWLVTGNDHRPNEFVRNSRPKLPRWPMVQGVLRFLGSSGGAARWLALSLGFGVSAGLLGFAFVQLGLAGGSLAFGALGYVMMGAAAGLFGAVLGLLTACSAAAHAMTVVTETSDGNDRIHQWPSPNPVEGFGDLVTIVTAAAVSAIPGWAIGSLVGVIPTVAVHGPLPQLIGVAASLVSFLPFVMLSQLAASSPWSLVTPEVASAVPRTIGSWLLLIVQNTILAALAVAAIALTALFPWLIFVAAPVLIGLAAIAFRLIGRLAWVVSERG